MPGSSEIRKTLGWRTASRFYRRPPGLGWLLALVAIPLLLAGLGYGVLGKNRIEVNTPSVNVPTVGMPSLSAPNMNLPKLSFAPLSIVRNGNDIALSGDLPDIGARAALLDKLKALFGSGVNFVDSLNIKPGINAPDIPSLDAVFKAGANIPDFNFKIGGDTVTLTGTAASENDVAAVEAAVKEAWPNIKIANEIEVRGPAPSPEPAPAPAPSPAPAGACADLQADISGLLRTPITFQTDEYTLSPNSQPQLTQVADKLKACTNAHATVDGYTDNTGNDAINLPLSANRAKSVADFLVSHGVAADHVNSKGMGSADPVASNDTPDGRAQNRRVVIVVS